MTNSACFGVKRAKPAPSSSKIASTCGQPDNRHANANTPNTRASIVEHPEIRDASDLRGSRIQAYFPQPHAHAPGNPPQPADHVQNPPNPKPHHCLISMDEASILDIHPPEDGVLTCPENRPGTIRLGWTKSAGPGTSWFLLDYPGCHRVAPSQLVRGGFCPSTVWLGYTKAGHIEKRPPATGSALVLLGEWAMSEGLDMLKCATGCAIGCLCSGVGTLLKGVTKNDWNDD